MVVGTATASGVTGDCTYGTAWEESIRGSGANIAAGAVVRSS
jgi:hypothetical protein